MANEIKVRITGDTTQLDKAVAESSRKFKSAIDANTVSLKAMRSAVSSLQSALVSLGGIAAFKQIAQMGIDLDKARNAMTALIGSVEKANAKLKELRELAKTSPGVTQTFAVDLFNRLKAAGGIADEVINKTIKSLGKLSTVFADVGPEFSRNLIQIFSTSFERDDIKQALNAVPIFEQLLESAFGTKDPAKLRAAKEAGVLTMNTFLLGMEDAINKRLPNVTESLGGKLQKSVDETRQRFAELGEKLLRDLLPVLEKLLPMVSDLLKVFTAMPRWLQATTAAFILMPGPIINAAKAIFSLAGSITTLAATGSNPGLVALARFGLIGAPLAIGFAVTQQKIEEFNRQLADRIELAKQDPRTLLDPRAEEARQGQNAALQLALKTGTLTPELQAALTLGGGSKKTKDKPFLDLSDFVGGGKKSGAASVAQRERERVIKDLLQKQADALVERREQDFKDFTDLNRALIEGLVKEEGRLRNLSGVQSFGVSLQRNLGAELRKLQRDTLSAEAEKLLQTGRRGLTRSGRLIGVGVERGQLTAGEAELLQQGAAGTFANQLREVLAIKEKTLAVNDPLLEDLREEIALYDQLSVSISDTERFMAGFNSQVETSGDIWERFGQNVARAFGNVRDLFNGLKRAVLDFFNDLLGNALQNLVRNTLGSLFNGIGGSLGNLFRTPSFGGGFGGGSGISAPPSISSVASSIPGLGGILRGLGGGGSSATTASAGGGGFSFGGLGQSFAAAAPLLGLSLGAGLGGQSIGGNILGGIGGALAGSAKSLIGLGSIAGIAGLVAAPLLIGGAILLGRAKQRRSDEEASGQMLTQALQGIEQLAASVASGQVATLGEARSIFESQVLGQFIQGIGGLKTKSVRESRLTNQVRDLRNVFESRIPPLIAEQEWIRAEAQRNALTHSRLVPEFATGGTSFGGLALLHPGEKILNMQQQAAVRSMAGPGVFERAGVPGPSANRNFDIGGTMPATQPLNITIDAVVVVSERAAEGIYVLGARSSSGQRINVDQVKRARLDGEL